VDRGAKHVWCSERCAAAAKHDGYKRPQPIGFVL